MIELLPIIILLISGLITVSSKSFWIGKYGAVVSGCLFLLNLLLKKESIAFNWFSISSIQFDFSFSFTLTGTIICLVITTILICLYFSSPINFFDNGIERKFGILNIFVFFMCFAILSDNIFQFYIGIEALGLISTFLVSIEKNSDTEATRVFSFNKFASLVFLIAIVSLINVTKSFDISTISKICDTEDYAKLLTPATLFLIACLCKGVQFPFSYWLLDAVKANIFASILIHAGTIVAIGIIFITKFYFIFECFPVLKNVMVAIGITTAFWMAFCALLHDNIKKIIACLTASSAGLMFIACGVGGYSLAILYFICHAFFKSMLFLSFSYLIAAMSGEISINKMGGIAKMAPKITDIIWISFMFAVGFPFLVGFYAKVSFAGIIDILDMKFLTPSLLSIDFIAILAIFRVLNKVLYGESHTDELTLSRSSKSNEYNMNSFWLLSIVAILCAFNMQDMFEWGNLHFGKSGPIYVVTKLDYLVETISRVAQIIMAIFAVMAFEKYSKKFSFNEQNTSVHMYRRHEIFEICYTVSKRIIMFVMTILDTVQKKLIHASSKKSFKVVFHAGNFLGEIHKGIFQVHAVWISIGATLVLAFTLFKELFG